MNIIQWRKPQTTYWTVISNVNWTWSFTCHMFSWDLDFVYLFLKGLNCSEAQDDEGDVPYNPWEFFFETTIPTTFSSSEVCCIYYSCFVPALSSWRGDWNLHSSLRVDYHQLKTAAAVCDSFKQHLEDLFDVAQDSYWHQLYWPVLYKITAVSTEASSTCFSVYWCLRLLFSLKNPKKQKWKNYQSQ